MRRWSEFEEREPHVQHGYVLAVWEARSSDGYVAKLEQAAELDFDGSGTPHVSWMLEISMGDERWGTQFGDAYVEEVPRDRFAGEVLPWATQMLEVHDGIEQQRVSSSRSTRGQEEWSAFQRRAPFWQDGQALEEWVATTASGDVAHLWEQSGRSPFIEGPERQRAWWMDIKDSDGWTLWQGAVDDHGGHIPRENFYDTVLPAAVNRLALADQQRDAGHSRDDGLGWDW